MPPNPILKRLGFSNTTRVVILHADDIGMCQASVDAYAELLDAGIMSSAAAMASCPWYPAAADYFRAHQKHPNFDVGVHLTLNSEWSNFRWGPLSTHDAASGLIDRDGYFYSRTAPTHENADPEAVETELTAQVERALASGYEITHMDTHMLALYHPRLLPPYIRVAQKFRLPAFLMRPDTWLTRDMPPDTIDLLNDAEARGMALFDHFDALSLDDHTRRLKEAQRALDALPVGLSALVFHPLRDTPEARAMAPDWRCRVGDYKLFLNDAFRQMIADSGVRVIGYRRLRDLLRRRRTPKAK